MLSLLIFLCLSISLQAANSKAHVPNPDNFFHFISRPDILAPRWRVEVYDREALQPDSRWFISPYFKLEQAEYFSWIGPHIYDTDGELVWSGAPMTKNRNAYDFRVSRVDGRDMLTFVLPTDPRGHGWVLDETYTPYKFVNMTGNSTKSNMHDFNLIDDGKRALMIVTQDYSFTDISVDGYTGPCRVGWQGFKEVDMESGDVLFEWNDRGHISVEESNFVHLGVADNYKDKCFRDWDITHFNSIDKFPDGDYLLSARHTDTIYKISHLNHSIIWRLGGSQSDFIVKDQRATFSRQHHSRIRAVNSTHTLISLFDNAVGSGAIEVESSGESWGLLLALRTDVQPMEVSLVQRYEKPISEIDFDDVAFTKARGSMSVLPNGNVFMGWAVYSHVSEHAADGRLLMHARLMQDGADSYRSYKMAWKGFPARLPDVVARVSRGDSTERLVTTVYVSWNGATEVATWNVLHTDRQGNASELVASSPRQGFETSVAFEGYARNVVAVALDAMGRELGRSKVIRAEVPDDLKEDASTFAVGETEWIQSHVNSTWSAPVSYEEESWISFQRFMAGVIGFGLVSMLLVGLYYYRRTGRWKAVRRRWYEPVEMSDGHEIIVRVSADEGGEKRYRDHRED